MVLSQAHRTTRVTHSVATSSFTPPSYSWTKVGNCVGHAFWEVLWEEGAPQLWRRAPDSTSARRDAGPARLTPMAPGAPAVKVRPPDVRSGDQFGCSTALSDSTVLIGACGDGWHSGVTGAGAAYLIEMQTHHQLAGNFRTIGAVTAHDATVGARFGSAVATTQTHFVVGADNHEVAHLKRGAAYVWSMQRDATGRIVSTTFRHKLLSTDANDVNFGRSIAMYGAKVAVGASGPDSYAAGFFQPKDNGAVYIFDVQGGGLIKRLSPVDEHGIGIAGCFGFGAAVAFADGLVVVGSPRARAPCTAGTAWGAVWIYETSSGLFTQTIMLSPTDGARSEFGSAVAILQGDRTNTRILVGAPGAVGGAAAGALYIVGQVNAPMALSSERNSEC